MSALSSTVDYLVDSARQALSISAPVGVAAGKLRSLRTRNREVQTAICRYRHGVTDHEVIVVGTIHLGSKGYFDELRAYLAGLDDGSRAMHYELIRKAGDEERAAATPEEREGLERLQMMGKVAAVLADLMVLPTQHVWYPLPGHWRNVDVSDLDVLRAHPDLGFLDGLEKLVETLQGADEDARRVLRWCMHFALRHMDGVRRVGAVLRFLRVSRTETLRDEFVLDHRNALAVEAAVAETRPVVTVWGAGHLPGMHDLLLGEGYRLVERQWVTAIRRGGRHALGREESSS